jgi:hypothetical protein
MDHSNIDGFEKPESINIKEIQYFYCYISRLHWWIQETTNQTNKRKHTNQKL